MRNPLRHFISNIVKKRGCINKSPFLVVSAILALLAFSIIRLSINKPNNVNELNSNSADSVFWEYLKKAGEFQSVDKSDSALNLYNKALDIAINLNNHSFISKCKNGIANHYLRKEDYSNAIKYLTEALKSAEISSDKHCEGLIANGLGLVHISIGKPEIAIEYFEKARQLCLQSNDLQNAAGISLNIANCFVEMDNFEKARDYYEDNLNTLYRINDTAQIILALSNLSTVNRYLNLTDKSFEFADRALELLTVFPENSLKCTALIQKGITYLTVGNLTNAKNYLNESLKISTGTLSRSNRMEAMLRLSEIAQKEGNYSSALELYKFYIQIKDSVMNDETRKSISEVQLKADIQKKELENQLLITRIEVQKKRNKAIGMGVSLFIIIILMSVILIWLSLKNLRKSFRLKELENANLAEKIKYDELQNKLELLRFQTELESKNKELTTISLQLVNKNKVLSDISSISSKQYNSGTIDSETYKGLQKIVSDNINSDREWENFKGLFEKVHSGFITGLKLNFPELSENELRLCAYLKINLQNKEIARILNVNPSTVVTSRYRIRKKLKLENKTVLEDFLRNF